MPVHLAAEDRSGRGFTPFFSFFFLKRGRREEREGEGKGLEGKRDK